MDNYVRCNHCGLIYSLGYVEVLSRYADCTVWKTPCCGRTVDDRRGFGQDATTPVDVRGDLAIARNERRRHLTPEIWAEEAFHYRTQYAEGHSPAELAARRAARTTPVVTD